MNDRLDSPPPNITRKPLQARSDSRSATTTQRKRRTGIRQSKNGCFNCKERRVKCDETHPSCLKCTRSARVCEGYTVPTPAHSQAPAPTLEVDCRALQIHTIPQTIHRTTPKNFNLSLLGCRILANDLCQDPEGLQFPGWTSLLPQFCHSHSFVNSAAAAFASTYIIHALSNKSPYLDAVAVNQYHETLAALQAELQDQSCNPTAIMLASSLLLSLELFMRREINALTHLQGALKVMSVVEWPSALPQESTHDSPEQGLCRLFRNLDIQASTYVLDRKPALPSSTTCPSTVQSSTCESFSEIHHHFMCLLHNTYNFTSQASKYKYPPRSSIPPNLLLEQGRIIAMLTNWASTLGLQCHLAQIHSRSRWRSDLKALLTLHVQCLSTLIYVSTVMNPLEVSYDVHHTQFRQIVQEAALIIQSDYMIKTPYQLFHLSPGLAQPLFFTATKSRQLSHRLQAIRLLREIGREGPWDGRAHGAVASRVMAIEMHHHNRHPAQWSSNDEHHVPLEAERVHGCGLEMTEVSDNSISSGLVHVMFSKCVDIQTMTSGSTPWEDERHWLIWREQVIF